MKLTQDQIDTIIFLHADGCWDREMARFLPHWRDTIAKYTDSRYLATVFMDQRIESLSKLCRIESDIEYYKWKWNFLLILLAIAILFNFI